VAEQQKLGRLTKYEARKHPQRHILTSALGISESPKIDLYRTKVIPNDLYLICSDGLNDMLDDEEILNIIHSIKDKSLFKIGLSLVLQANLAGGQDNITVILLSF
jgi:protein phosphatase